VLTLVVAVFGEMRDEGVICETAHLGEAIHAASYLDVNVAIVDKWGQFVEFEDVGWYSCNRDAHVLVVRHWSTKIKIFDVSCWRLGRTSRN
jgi:hypothetical protein